MNSRPRNDSKESIAMNTEAAEALGPDAIDNTDIIDMLWEDCDLEAMFSEAIEDGEVGSDYRLAA